MVMGINRNRFNIIQINCERNTHRLSNLKSIENMRI